MRLEAVRTMLDSNGEHLHENGLLLGFMRETESYGAVSLEGSLPEGGNGVFTAWQRGVAFNGGWQANNGLGVLYTPSIDLARRQYRFFIPIMTMVGGSTEWINESGATFSAGLGQPGLYTGIRVPAFHQVSGTVYSVGGQIPPGLGLGGGNSSSGRPWRQPESQPLPRRQRPGAVHQRRTGQRRVDRRRSARPGQSDRRRFQPRRIPWRRLDRRMAARRRGGPLRRHLPYGTGPALGQPADRHRPAGRLLPGHLPGSPMAMGRRGGLRHAGVGGLWRHHFLHRQRPLPVFPRLGFRRRHECPPRPERRMVGLRLRG